MCAYYVVSYDDQIQQKGEKYFLKFIHLLKWENESLEQFQVVEALKAMTYFINTETRSTN